MSEQVLTIQDIKLHEESSDKFAPLFWYKNRLLRSHVPDHQHLFNKIIALDHPLIQHASKTELTLDLSSFDYLGLKTPVYEHKIYSHRTRIWELPLTQAKAVITTICKLNADLVTNGLIAKDVHESNVCETIDGIKWMDYGGIFDCTTENCTTSFVLISYLVQKYILKTINCNAYDTCLNDVKNSNDIMSTFIDRDFTQSSTWLEVAEAIEKITVVLEPSHWSDNYSNTMDIDHPDTLGEKGINVWNILQKLDYETVTDVGCNKGYYSFLAAKKAKSVVGFDLIPACIDIAQQYNKQFKLPVIFAAKTIESIYEDKCYETYRFKSDLVMALAIVHHIGNVISPENFTKTLSNICNKYVLIEDINDSADVYQKHFEENGFVLDERIASTPSPRTLSLYRKL